MEIYIDSDCKCYTTEKPDRKAVEVDVFDGKCAQFIKGHRYIPLGESWENSDGQVFRGEMISPWRDLNLLNEFQAQYEAQLAAADAAYQEGVNTAYD